MHCKRELKCKKGKEILDTIDKRHAKHKAQHIKFSNAKLIKISGFMKLSQEKTQTLPS